MWSAIAVLGGIAFVSALGLGIASRFFAVEVDPKVKQIEEILPGANCGGCGFAGCAGYAEAVVNGNASPSSCAPGGSAVAEQIGRILGLEIKTSIKRIAYVFCQGGPEIAKEKYEYAGIQDCKAAALLIGGAKACPYGCLGLGSCVRVCHFNAIMMGENNIPVINPQKCTSCGKCVSVCPKNIVHLVPITQGFIVACSSHEKGKKVKDVCKVGCIACQICVKKCPSEAIHMEDSLAVIDPQKCTGCGICWEKCPQKIIWASETPVIVSGEKEKKSQKIPKT